MLPWTSPSSHKHNCERRERGFKCSRFPWYCRGKLPALFTAAIKSSFSARRLFQHQCRDRDRWQGRNMSTWARKGLDTHFPIQGSTTYSLYPEMQIHSHVAPLNVRLPCACPVPRQCCALQGVSKDSDMQIHRQACACCNMEEAAEPRDLAPPVNSYREQAHEKPKSPNILF